MWFILIFLLTAAGIINSLPAPALTLQYETGSTYKYNYQFTVLLNEDSNITSRSASVGQSVGYKVSSEFLLSSLWQSPTNIKEKLLKLELLKPTLHVSSTMHSPEGIKHWSKLDNLSYPPIYIHWDDGIVKKVYILPDSPSMVNIKKGLASLFQLHVSNSPVKELDVSGLCDIKYKAHGNTIKKNKYNCQRSARNNYSTEQQSQLRSPTISSFSETLITLIPQENVIQSVTGREEVMMTLNLWKQAAVFVKAKLHVNYIDKYKSNSVMEGKDLPSVLKAIAAEMASGLKGETLEVVSEENTCNGNCKSLQHLVKEYGNNLLPENLGKVKSAAGFLKMLEGFRRSSKKELLVLFKDSDERILPQLLDVLAAAQTEDSIDVAFQLVDFESKDIAIAERFLLCLATLPYPNEVLITKTMKLLSKKIKVEKLRITILITVSSLMKTYCKNNPKNINSLVVQNVNGILLKELQACKDVACIMTYLLALRNAALPQNLPILMEYAKQGGIVGLVALEAMKDTGEQHFTKKVKDVLLRIYNQFWPHQESGARVLAAELLIKSDPRIETVGSIVMSLANQEFPEINTLVLSKLYSSMQTNNEIRSCVKEVLRNVTFGNYNNLAQNGSSTSYIDLLQATHDVNISYGINMEMRPTGMLKRTNFDLSMLSGAEHKHLLSLGLFVEGFGLTDEEQKNSPEEHAAGMQLSVLGVHLRPYTFFTGTSELMGLVWSGVGSEPTTAFQANFLFMDQTFSTVLQNGITVEFNLKGTLSADVSGTAEVSMWNQNAHAKVLNSGALLVNGFCKVDTSFVESHVDFALGGSSTMDMFVDLVFAKKPMKICLQIEQPGFTFRHNVRKTETIPGSKHLLKTLKRRSMHFSGKSFNLHQKNSDSCRELLFEKPKSASFW